VISVFRVGGQNGIKVYVCQEYVNQGSVKPWANSWMNLCV
jgi:hypothetical protein